MLYGLNNDQDNEINDFHQRVADRSIQSIDERQEEIQRAKNGFIGILAGIFVGGAVAWLFLGPSDNLNQEKEIPVIRRPIIPAKIQPNDPGGMDIDNQDRDIYHIVDNLPKENTEVNIQPAPEMPKLVVENTIPTPENIENLVESIEDDDSLKQTSSDEEMDIQSVKVANTELSAIKTNSKEKIIIPEKIKEIDVKLQNTIKSQSTAEIKDTKEPVKNIVEQVKVPQKPEKGTWYAQIIASSKRSSVVSLWNNLSSKHGFLKTYTHEIEEITSANGSTLYRLKVGAFKTRKEADALSQKLKQNKISSIIKQN